MNDTLTTPRARLNTEYRALYAAVRRWKARLAQAQRLEQRAIRHADVQALSEARAARAQAEKKHAQALRVAIGGIRRIARRPPTRPRVEPVPLLEPVAEESRQAA